MGVELLSVTYPDYGVRAATPAEADRLLRQRSSGRSLAALPSDTFTVSGSIGYITRTGEYVVQGNWNFKNSFVGGDPTPTDMAGLSVRSNCYNVRGTYWSIYDYAGNGHNGLGYLYDAQPDGDTALAIEDRVSGFVLYSDNGNLRYFMRASGCYTRDFQASFSFEHNQESGVVTSVSINLGIFNVSYSTTPLKLKKSTGIFS